MLLALMAVPWFLPVLLDSCHPSGRGRRVKARQATACRLALTRPTRPRQSSSGKDGSLAMVVSPTGYGKSPTSLSVHAVRCSSDRQHQS